MVNSKKRLSWGDVENRISKKSHSELVYCYFISFTYLCPTQQNFMLHYHEFNCVNNKIHYQISPYDWNLSSIPYKKCSLQRNFSRYIIQTIYSSLQIMSLRFSFFSFLFSIIAVRVDDWIYDLERKSCQLPLS